MTDAHVHPDCLVRVFPKAEAERRALNIACAASAWSAAECDRNEALASAAALDGAPPVFCCCAIHPQLPLALKTESAPFPFSPPFSIGAELEALERRAAEGRLAAIGETGFDLYDAAYRETGAEQEKLFAAQLEIAASYGLPLVLHVRRALHKIFACTKQLKKIPAVVFHSWPGTSDDGFSLLRRGVNAFFSFGTALLLNHQHALRSCALFPAERLLAETDAPYQSPRFREYSSYRDCKAVLSAMADLRKAGGQNANGGTEPETIVDRNFYRIFTGG
ncbi:MAG: TatD family hydrolase [Treponema sp.]|jgi:TatD DNase family protein|nr:TatD family hydrolase [Treponema sp.]